MVLVVTALAGAEVRVFMHELDGWDPLDHLETELVLEQIVIITFRPFICVAPSSMNAMTTRSGNVIFLAIAWTDTQVERSR
jgi:hypothetical protein